jgi:hypothetical protein
MNMDGRDKFVYQIRTGRDKSPSEIMMELTRAVWMTLIETAGLSDLDARDSAGLYSVLLKIFQKRCVLYEDCGTLEQCASSINIYKSYPDDAKGGIYILILRGGLLRFVQSLADLVCRRFHANLWPSGRRRKAFRDRLQGALHRALSSYLYYNKACLTCPARMERPFLK